MSRSLARIALMGMAATALAVFAHAGEEPRKESAVPANAQVTRFTRFNIRYKLRDIVAQGVQKVDFYITKDMGKTWEYYGEDFDKASPMTVEVPGEGIYGFVCVVTDRNGNREREPRPGTRPETVIVVDRTPPTAKWLSPAQDILGRGSHIELEWEAADDHFGPNPVKLQYSSDAKNNHDRNAKWFMIQENLPVKGSIRWTPPDSKKYHFRLVAEDRAGNAAVAYCAASVKVDNTPPYIVGVKPLRSNKLENHISVEAKDEDGGSGVKEYSLYVSENGATTWNLVKEAGIGGESLPVKRRSGDTITWKAPKGGEYPLWPVVFDEAGNATPLPSIGVAGPYILVIDNEPPNVTLSSSFLMGGSSILSNQSRQVEWTSYDPHPKEGTTKILLSVDNGKNWQELASRQGTSGFSTVNFPFGAHGRECKLKVTVEDDFGNVGEAVSETFRLSGAQTTVDSVTPRSPRPSTDANDDIFGSGGASSGSAPSGGGWFGGFGGSSDAGSDSGSGSFGFGDLPSLPRLPSDGGEEPSLPPLPPRGSTGTPALPSGPSGGGLQSLPGFGGGDGYGGSRQDIYGGEADGYAPQSDAGSGSGDIAGGWRRVSAAGPLPSAIVGDALEPDPNAPASQRTGGFGGPAGLPGLGGLIPPGASRDGVAAAGAAEDEWKPSPAGGRTSTVASSGESSYLSGERMPWESGSSSGSGGGLPPGLLGGITPPGGASLPPPPGGGLVPPPPGGGMSGGITGSLTPPSSTTAYVPETVTSWPDSGTASTWDSGSSWQDMPQVPTQTAADLAVSQGDLAVWDQDYSRDSSGYQQDYLSQVNQPSTDWSTGDLVPGGIGSGAPVLPSIPSTGVVGGSSSGFDSSGDWSVGADVASVPAATGADEYSDDMSDWSSSPAGGIGSGAAAPTAPGGLSLPGLSGLTGGLASSGASSGGADRTEMRPPVLPSGSLRPPSSSSSPSSPSTPSMPSMPTLPPTDTASSGGLSLPPLGGGLGEGSSFPSGGASGFGGLDDMFASGGSDDYDGVGGGSDDFASGSFPGGFDGSIPMPGDLASGSGAGSDTGSGVGLPGLSGLPGMGSDSSGSGGWELPSGDDGEDDWTDSFGGDDDVAYVPGSPSDGGFAGGSAVSGADEGDGEDSGPSSLPWPARTTELPPETPQGPPPSLPGLERQPTTGVFQPPPLETTPPGQRPVNKRQESEHFVRESKAFREEGRPDLALSSATKAVEADSTNANAYMELSQVNARMAPPDHVRAANLAKEATNLRADWETWWNCADVFYIWAHACNREIQSLSRGGQSAPVHLVDERNSTLSNALIAVNNAASVMPRGDREAAKKVGITQGMVTYLRALTVPEPANPGAVSGPALDEYRRQQAQYKGAVLPLLQEAIPYFKNVLDMGGAPGYQETFQLGIIYFRLAGLERDTGNPEQASSNYQDAVRYLEQATTSSDTPKEGPREAYYMLALSHDQLAEQPGSNRARHKELALRYWRQTADFYDAGSTYRTYAEQRIEVLSREMGL